MAIAHFTVVGMFLFLFFFWEGSVLFFFLLGGGGEACKKKDFCCHTVELSMAQSTLGGQADDGCVLIFLYPDPQTLFPEIHEAELELFGHQTTHTMLVTPP